MPKLKDFITAENELDGQEYAYISQSDKTRKTTLQKIKELIIGPGTLNTTNKAIIGSINEVKTIADSNTTSLSEITQKTSISFPFNDSFMEFDSAASKVIKNSFGMVTICVNFCHKDGTTLLNESIGTLPIGYRPSKDFCSIGRGYSIIANADTFCNVAIKADGTVNLRLPSSNINRGYLIASYYVE